jgi:lipopolysaccharide/colanic/teichoic acid biosynthesis glycosyltransferase
MIILNVAAELRHPCAYFTKKTNSDSYSTIYSELVVSNSDLARQGVDWVFDILFSVVLCLFLLAVHKHW